MAVIRSGIGKLARGRSILGVGSAFALLDVGMNYMEDVRENPERSTAARIARAVGQWALWEIPITRPFMWAGVLDDVGMALGMAATQLYHQGVKNRKTAYMGNFGGYFEDNDIRATMRQRGLAAIQQARLNARSILGNEARMLHRGR